MKTIKLCFNGLVALAFFSAGAQDVASTSTLTSGGNLAGTAGTGNTFYGYKAGNTNTSTGLNNTFIGNETGSANTTGDANTFLGTASGEYNTTGTSNIFIGSYVGSNNTTGSVNLFIGNGTAESNYSGIKNTIIGHEAGVNGNGSGNVFIGFSAGFYEMDSDKLYITNDADETPLIWGDFALDQLKLNGKVGIGAGFPNFPTTAGGVDVSEYSLFVKGGILTEEVRVSLNGTWADYVFAKDYRLPSLNEVEKHIAEKGHLINVPSAAQICEDGIGLGEMARIQQEKIEELTLYIIEQNKINEKQGREIQELKTMVLGLIQKNN